MGRRSRINQWQLGHWDRFDLVSWGFVLVFFGVSAMACGGQLLPSLMGAVLIVGLMAMISACIHIVLSVVSRMRNAGEMTGVIDNGPELLVSVAGLMHGHFYFAIGVSLGSNFANILLLALAALITHRLSDTLGQMTRRTHVAYLLTLLLAGVFYASSSPAYWWGWTLATAVLLLLIWRWRPKEDIPDDVLETASGWLLLPAVLILAVAGYALDPVAKFTAVQSRVPLGVISFVILSILTSWPEFRSVLSLFQRERPLAAVLCILISNIAHLWLAIGVTLVYLLAA